MPRNFTESEVASLAEEFGLTYHMSYANVCSRIIGFENKDILEVGGSLPGKLVLDHLNAKSWCGIESSSYEEALASTGGISHAGTVLKDSSAHIFNSYPDHTVLDRYSCICGDIESLPNSYFGQYDMVFSIAAFEHIRKLPQALEKMYQALRPGGKLFSLFSPMWQSHNGHHLPEITDQQGRHYNFNNCPVPPWSHLIMGAGQMLAYLKNHTDPATAAKMVYYIYNAENINRFFAEDYANFINESPFLIQQLEGVFPVNLFPENIKAELASRFPKQSGFEFEGLLIVLVKEG